MIKLNKKNVAKIPNKSGIYILYDRNKKPIYYGSSKVLKHRLQSYYQKDDFSVNKTKKGLRNKIVYFAWKLLPIKKARQFEKKNMIKKNTKYNFKKSKVELKTNPHKRVKYKGKEYLLSDIKIKDLRDDFTPAEISLVIGALIVLLIIWGAYTYGD